jgi:glutamate-ammonia-ligase adenylyltransferase
MKKEGKIPGAHVNLDKIGTTYIQSGLEENIEQFLLLLQRELKSSADADMALNNLLRFIEASYNKTSLLSDLTKFPHLLEILIKTFSTSQYFADILVRDPELFRWLTTTGLLTSAKTKKELLDEAAQVASLFKTVERKINALKRFYRREILRIGVSDVLGELDLIAVTQQLSDLADAIISTTCSLGSEISIERFGSFPNTQYAVIGLGKLGGSELNYSSDVDILFVYDEDGEFEGHRGKVVSQNEFFNSFAEICVQLLTEHTEEGYLYRVDLRLRPDGKSGALSRSLASYLTYYESKGELWERQMLLKSRVVAGNVDFGNRFLSQLQPFIYPRTLFQSPLKEIARIKSRIEAVHLEENNIKLGIGGIRDIEFIVQALQLLKGGTLAEVREKNTLIAIDKLNQANLLQPNEARTLVDAYTMFRTIEHRLQMMQAIQTHSLPSEPRERAMLARRVGFKGRHQFEDTLKLCLDETRKIFESVFRTEFDQQAADTEVLLSPDVEDYRIEGVLKRYGFKKLRDDLRSIQYLAYGASLTGRKEFDVHVRDLFRNIAPMLLGEISHSLDPDRTLFNLERMIRSSNVVEVLYRLLEEERVRRLLLTVCSYSPHLSNQIARNDRFLEILLSQETFSSPDVLRLDERSLGFNLQQLKQYHELRIGIRNLLGLSTFEEMARELTDLAKFIINHVYQETLAAYGLSGDSQFAVIGLGKLGGGEMNFDSDLDVIFIYEASGFDEQAYHLVASSIIDKMSRSTELGRLYEVDARLRPEGRNAPLATSLDTFAHYLEKRASLWERQSLLKADFIVGNRRFADKALAHIERFVYGGSISPRQIDGIIAMRKRIEARSQYQRVDLTDIKVGAGGVLDIEFLVQAFQLVLGTEHKQLRGRNTLHVLRDLRMINIIESNDFQALERNYLFLREIEKFMRISLETRSTILPSDVEQLEYLARCVGFKNRAELTAEAKGCMKKTREIFTRLMKHLQNPQ